MNTRLKRAPKRAVLLGEWRHGVFHAILACGHKRKLKRATYRPLECVFCLGAVQEK